MSASLAWQGIILTKHHARFSVVIIFGDAIVHGTSVRFPSLIANSLPENSRANSVFIATPIAVLPRNPTDQTRSWIKSKHLFVSRAISDLQA
jgi:hypothetical protein